MKPYVIKQGDYLSKLAFKMGFDPKVVWDDGKNADLKKLRASGEILAPGDVIYVPDDPRPKLPYSKETKNAYKAKVPKLTVRLVLQGPGGKPLANEPYVVKGIGKDDEEKSSDGDGSVTIEVPATLKSVDLLLPKRKAKLAVQVGGLDPVNVASGAKMRLEHLGLYGATFEANADGVYASRDVARLAGALKAFQSQKGLPTSGELDDATQKALVAAHGS